MNRTPRNALAITMSDIGRRIIGFAATAYLARVIGTEGFGLVNIGLTVLSYVLMISSAGLHTLGIRAVAKGDEERIVNAVISGRLVNSLMIVSLTLIILYLAIHNATVVSLCAVFLVSAFVNAFLLDWYFQGKEAMMIVGISKMLNAFIYLSVIMLFVHSGNDLVYIAVATIVGDVVASAILLREYGKSGKKLHLHPFDFTEWKKRLKESLSLGTGSMLAHISTNLSPIVIAIVLTNADVGLFSAANKMVVLLLIVDRVAASILLPVSSRVHSTSANALQPLLSMAIKWIIIMTVPLCVGSMLLADKIIPVIFGNAYAAASDIYSILVWFLFFTALHTVYTSGIIVVGQEKRYGYVMTISAVFYVITVYLCTVLFGLKGAAVGMVFSEAVTFFLMRNQCEKYVSIPFDMAWALTIVCALLMGLVVWLLASWNLFIVICLGALVYIILLFMTKVITFGEVQTLIGRT